MIPIGMLLQGGIAAAQLIKGIKQKNKRPEAEVTGATNEMVNSARLDANVGQRPGRRLADQRIRQESANALSNVRRNTSDVNKILAMASTLSGAQNRAMQQQDALDIQAREGAKGRLQSALSRKSAEQMRVWDFNKGLPYQQAEMMKRQNIGAGLQNAMTGANDYSSYLKMVELGLLDPNKVKRAAPSGLDGAAVLKQVEAYRNPMMKSAYQVWGTTPRLGQSISSYPHIRKL